MTPRYDRIAERQGEAETLTAAARADVAEYEAQLASVRAEAQQKVDAARATLEAERTEQIAAVNARIAEKRGAAAAEVDAARRPRAVDVESAVADVSTRLDRDRHRSPTERPTSCGVAVGGRHESRSVGMSCAQLPRSLAGRLFPAAEVPIDDKGYTTSIRSCRRGRN